VTDIVLATINARWAHASLGLRCLRASLGALRERSRIVELTLDERPSDMAERLLAERPHLIGLGVYVWNARPSSELVSILKRVRPDVFVVLGGPEVGFEPEALPIASCVDYVIAGEGESAFAKLAHALLAGEHPEPKLRVAKPPDLARQPLPYDEYDDVDLSERTVYVEASRGCVFGCEFCLSSIERCVRRVPLERLLPALERLWQRGLRRYRFVDRTFNLSPAASERILEFFLKHDSRDLFVHVEVIPDRLPPSLVALMARFPPGALQLEIGIQTFDDAVAARIGRAQHGEVAAALLTRLRQSTRAHLHADLIVGLPGEGLDGLQASFDRLVACAPHEIQLGILKRLRGALIARHDAAFHMVYATEPPYELLQNRDLDFVTLQRLKRFSRYWDLVANSGRFQRAVPLLYEGGSPFAGFLSFSDWLFARAGGTHGIALERLTALVRAYLCEQRGVSPLRLESCFVPEPGQRTAHLPRRQARHHQS
jgi:hypothetical protein